MTLMEISRLQIIIDNWYWNDYNWCDCENKNC